MAFALPDALPESVVELDGLLDAARKSINVIQARHEAGENLTSEDVAELERLLDAVDTLTASRAEAATAEQAREEQVSSLMNRAQSATSPEQPEQQPDEPEQPDQPEQQPESAPEPQPNADPQPDGGDGAQPEQEAEVVEGEVVTADGRPVRFGGVGPNTVPVVPGRSKEPGWEVDPSCPGYTTGMPKVGFNQLGQMLDGVRGNSRARNRPNKPGGGEYAAQTIARLHRENMEVIGDSHALVAAISKATDESKLPGGSLTAAGGWCAPSEQLYDFCDVPNASDLLSLPDITIRRGGVRWPVEPDLTALFEDFEWFFTEPQLEAVDSGTGDPTAVKTCVDIPCPDEFVELRLNAVGYCVEAGILLTQGWPELVAWFMQFLAQEHLRSMSRRTILDMVSGSTAVSIGADTTFGVVPSVLNSLEMQAWNLRAQRGLPRTATIEGVAPSWLPAVMRADLAMQEGLGTKSVTDAQVIGWLADRNIALQLVGDWQTRSAGLPGNLATVAWPSSVDVLLYPAGTWFRALSPIIELGVMYPREQLQVNRYTRFFTEDALAVGKRCNNSLAVTIPICVSGAISDRVAVTCAAGS